MMLESINKLRRIGARADHILYDICYRRAVGIIWSDESRLKGQSLIGNNYKEALYIETYYPSLSHAIKNEIKRLKNLTIKEKCPQCGKKIIIELSNKCVSGGVLLCTSCNAVSPFANSTVECMFEWGKNVKNY